MKKIVCLVMFSVVSFWSVSAWAEVAINAMNFPDPAFRYIIGSVCDTNFDGMLDASEISSTHTLQLNEQGIITLKGIEYFTDLNILYCYNNKLTALNVSNNKQLKELFCNSNYLTTLDVSKNVELEQLEFWSNDLKAIDVSHNTALKILNCGENQIAALDVSKNTLLNRLYCHSNQLTTLDLSSNKNFFEVNFASQIVYGLNITSTGDSSYPYQLNLGKYVPSNKLANVSNVKGIDANGSPIQTTFAGGTAMFEARPAKVTYEYDTGCSYKYDTGYRNPKMAVTITEAKEDTKPSIITLSLTGGKTLSPYTQTLEATGSTPITWSISSGKLPDGLALAADGTISGIPSKAGTFKFSARATNSAGHSQKQFSIKILASPEIFTESLKSATVGKSYSETLKADGSTPITWTIDGTIPDGLTFSGSKFTGKPTTKGVYTFSVTASNDAGTDTKTLSIDVHAVLPVIGTSRLPAGTWGKRYNAKISVKNGTKPVTLSIADNLPEGLSFNAETGEISGIPQEICKNLAITVTAANEEGTTSKTYELTIRGVIPKINTSSLPPAAKGKEYHASLEASGNTPITLTAQNLPAGLSLTTNSAGTSADISGTPTESGTFRVTLIAANNTPASSRKILTLKVIAAPEIFDDFLTDGNAEERYRHDLEFSGTKPVTFSVSEGTLPHGITLNARGTLSGTPKEAGAFTFTLKAENSAGSATKSFTLTVNAIPPRIIGNLPAGKVGTAYTSSIRVTGSMPLVFSCAESLPAGLNFDTETGTISGTPQEAFDGCITVKAENSGGVHQKVMRLLIRPSTTTNNTSLPEEGSENRTESLPAVNYYSEPEAVHVTGDYVIAAVLPVVSVDEAGMYDFAAVLSDDAPEGGELMWLAFSSEPSEDDAIAEFFDETGAETSCVPVGRKVSVSAWLNPERVYRPVIAVKR